MQLLISDLFGEQIKTALPPSVTTAMEDLAGTGGVAARGAIFTRPEVVDFILDLAGYTEDQPLYKKRVLEPSFGGGDFLLPIVRRLLVSWKAANGTEQAAWEDLNGAIRAVELHRDTFHSTHTAVANLLEEEGLSTKTAMALADCWLVQDDFLLTRLDGLFDFVIGNPPYVRQELIPAPLVAVYRHLYQTMYDRADLYIPFIERSLRLLTNGGTMGFICADRWMKNRYGGPLRNLVAKEFHLKIYVDMAGTSAFHSEVIAYPAITIISHTPSGTTRVAHNPAINHATLAALSAELRTASLPKTSRVRELEKVTNGAEPWLIESSDQMGLIRRLEKQFPSLEEVGCKVGIGVATGADKAFIGDFDSLDVEPTRKLPLVTTRDIKSGEVKWRGLGVINPFSESGGLVDLNSYPRLRRYLEARKEAIAERHCAQKSPASWYRTIDRITPALTQKPKLLIPDIKGEAHIVYERGELYPHHNLYYVTSETWDLRALQAVMLSAITRLFIATYSTKMHGGCLRFQAQYLRRIRLPLWEKVSQVLRNELIEAATTLDVQACNRAAFKLYNLSHEERSALGGNGE